jgi:hypothetical protein
MSRMVAKEIPRTAAVGGKSRGDPLWLTNKGGHGGIH